MARDTEFSRADAENDLLRMRRCQALSRLPAETKPTEKDVELVPPATDAAFTAGQVGAFAPFTSVALERPASRTSLNREPDNAKTLRPIDLPHGRIHPHGKPVPCRAIGAPQAINYRILDIPEPNHGA